MNILFLIVGIVIGIALGWFFQKSKSQGNDSEEKVIQLDKEKGIIEERLRNSIEENQKQQEELRASRELLSLSTARIAKAEEAYKNMQEKLSSQKVEMEEMQKKFSIEFENIANRLLEDKSKKFTEQNKTNMDVILNPLKEKIKEFEEKVDKTYKEESAERITLKAEIKHLVELNKQVSEDANNLANALKGDNKKQGNWGEVILEKVLERSGLVNGQEYKTQFSTTNEEGKRIQPDVVIFLPDQKHVIVDAKVSLVAYEAFINAVTEEDKDKYIKEHINSLKTHVKTLSEKNYQTSADFNTPDFVLLFVPIESSFSLAVQADHELFNYAWDKKIVIVSPSTLLATLRTIASIWKQEKQTKNAIDIAEQSGKLYDKFVGFVEDLITIGKKMNDAKISYDEAMKKLHTGTGNLVRRAENIKALGAKTNTTKSIPQSLIDRIEE